MHLTPLCSIQVFVFKRLKDADTWLMDTILTVDSLTIYVRALAVTKHQFKLAMLKSSSILTGEMKSAVCLIAPSSASDKSSTSSCLAWASITRALVLMHSLNGKLMLVLLLCGH